MNIFKTQNEICQAIDIIVQQAIATAGFDKTIQANIISCTDSSIGQYKVKYQDSTFYAYAQNPKDNYSNGAGVYILIQNNDMSRDKFIIGTVDKLGQDYIAVTDKDSRYEILGANSITQLNDIELCSYKEASLFSILDRININEDNLLQYVKQDASHIVFKIDVRTALDPAQQRKGDYGLVFSLKFKDHATGSEVIRDYTLNIDKMNGNPYNYINPESQSLYIAIDATNFIGIKDIQAFCYKFPNQDSNMPNDIFLNNLGAFAAIQISDEVLSGSYLSLVALNGTIFSQTQQQDLPITVIARKQGLTITENIHYYWFIEDLDIDVDSADFSVYGGRGWKCLNFYDIIEVEDGSSYKEWKSGDKTKYFHYIDHNAQRTNYKVVAVLNDGTILEKTFVIVNMAANNVISLISDKGTQFYFDQGQPTLTVTVLNNGTDVSNSCVYKWAKIDSDNNYSILSETSRKLQVLIKDIENFAIFKCGVYYSNLYIGTVNITLTNTLETEGLYNLTINNGSQIFVYDEAGIAPTSELNENPMTLLPLSFDIYNNLGNYLEEDVLEQCSIQWAMPITNTMLSSTLTPKSTDDKYAYFENEIQFNYQIASSFANLNRNNNILLTVTYKDLILKAETNFVFIKEGESGTNGTGIVARIDAVNGSTPISEYPTYSAEVLASGTTTYKKNYSNLRFRVVSADNINNPIVNVLDSGSGVTWGILKNKYNSSTYDTSNLTYTSGTGVQQNNYRSGSPADIVTATVVKDGVKYYATLPLITIKYYAAYGYKPKLLKGSGFRNVLYASDGTNPKQDGSFPFEIIMEPISNGTLTANSFTYTWSIKGTDNGSTVKAYLKENTNKTLNKNQKSYSPIEVYDGRSVTIALECVISYNGTEYGRIHIPIYFSLNQYGYNLLNDWDGNSLEIDENGNHILTPQIGAGAKNSDNTFTGLLMGKMSSGDRSSTKIGLLGFNRGVQTIFLDAETGSASFGKSGIGQIILDPSNEAVIKSGNYNAGSAGMLINLTSPSIEWGNGKFSVNNNGILSASEAKISGDITATNLTLSNGLKVGSNFELSSTGILKATSVDLSGKIVASSGTIGGWTIGNTRIQSSTTIALGEKEAGLMIINESNRAFIVAQDANATVNFSVDRNGILSATGAKISGEIVASSGYIGTSASGFEIQASYIRNGAISSVVDTSHAGVRIGTDGINISGGTAATTTYITKGSVNIGGKLTWDGTLLNVQGHIVADSGLIGSLNINTSGSLYTGTKSEIESTEEGFHINSTGGIYIGPYDFENESCSFQVNKDGTMYANKATITGAIIATSIRAENNYKLYGESDTARNALQLDTDTSGFLNGYLKVGGGFDGIVLAKETWINSNLYVEKDIYASGENYFDKNLYVYGDFDVAGQTNLKDLSLFDGGNIYFDSPNQGIYIDYKNDGSYMHMMYCTTGDLYLGGSGDSTISLSDSVPVGNCYIIANNVYKKTSGGNTDLSDRRHKENIEDISNLDAYNFIMSLNPKTFKYKDGTSNRLHSGFIAQEVEASMKQTSIKDFGVFVRYTFNPEIAINEKDSNTYTCGLRYNELIAPHIKVTQIHDNLIHQLMDKVDELEKQIKQLQAKA